MKDRIKEIMKKEGFVRQGKRDLWVRGSWTIKFFENDIEIYDDIERSGKYILQNIDFVDIRAIINDIDIIQKI